MSRKEILINVDNSFLENSLEKEHIIQQDAYEACKKLLKKKLELSKNYKAKNFDRFHEAITVLGERGTGKTSFILGMKNIIDKSDDNDLKEIQTMDILDPTLLSDRQIVLITIVSSIRESVITYMNKSNNIDENEVNEWNSCLLNLAEGLNSILSIGNDPSKDGLWDDAGLILEKGLTKAKAGVNFEKEFHKYIEKSLNIINKKAFLLMLDDIDTDFNKGWDVLETLRKYISTPHIIIIISGDLNLYSKLIRQKKIDLFKDLIEFEESNKENYIKSVDSLQEQYLIKLLKPENYINLHSLNYYLTYKKDSYKMEIKNNTNDIELLSVFVEKLFTEMFNNSSYKNIFLSMPIRTNIQLFKAYFDSKGKNKEQQYFFQRLKDIFITTFFNFGIEMKFFELLRENNNINNLLSDFVFNEKFDFIELSDLKPDSDNNNLNTMICIISGIFDAYFVDKPNKFIEWMLKIVLTKELIRDLELTKKDSYLLLDKHISSEKRILRYLGFIHDKNYLFVKTYKHKSLIEVNDNEDIFETVKGRVTKKTREFLLYLPYYEVKTKRTEIEDRFSFLFILSFLEKLLSCNEFTQEDLKKEIDNHFKELLKNRIIKIPKLMEAEKKEKKANDQENEVEENSSEVNADISISLDLDLIKNIHYWLAKINFSNSILKLNEINTLFTNFLLRNINVIKTSTFDNLNEYLSVVIYSFLNELLIVSYENKATEIKTFREIKTYSSSKINFTANYNSYKIMLPEAENDYSDLFISILNCPLWYYYLEGFDAIVNNEGYTNIERISQDFEKIIIHNTKMNNNLFKDFINKYKSTESTVWSLDDVEEKSKIKQKNLQSNKKFGRPFPLKSDRILIFNEVFNSPTIVQTSTEEN